MGVVGLGSEVVDSFIVVVSTSSSVLVKPDEGKEKLVVF